MVTDIRNDMTECLYSVVACTKIEEYREPYYSDIESQNDDYTYEIIIETVGIFSIKDKAIAAATKYPKCDYFLFTPVAIDSEKINVSEKYVYDDIDNIGIISEKIYEKKKQHKLLMEFHQEQEQYEILRQKIAEKKKEEKAQELQNLINDYLDDIEFFKSGEIDEYYAEKKLARKRSLYANIEKIKALNIEGCYDELLAKAEAITHVDEEILTMEILTDLEDDITFFMEHNDVIIDDAYNSRRKSLQKNVEELSKRNVNDRFVEILAKAENVSKNML